MLTSDGEFGIAVLQKPPTQARDIDVESRALAARLDGDLPHGGAAEEQARLLVLERLTNPEARTSYLESRRALRSRPAAPGFNRRLTRRQMRRRKGDLKADEEVAGLDMNDYEVSTLHIPYGPGWTARRIDKLVYQTVSQSVFFRDGSLNVLLLAQDLGMNCRFG